MPNPTHCKLNKAIRDGKYLARDLARHMSVLANLIRPLKIEKFVGQVFEIYAIELLGSMSTDEACVTYVCYTYIRSTLAYREYVCKSL